MKAYITDKFYEVLYHKISITDFEQWVYTTGELKNDLSGNDYFELLSLNYRDKHILHELKKWIGEDALFSFKLKQLKEMLCSIIYRENGYQCDIEEMYHLFCSGYWFLRKLGMDYGYFVMANEENTKLSELIDGFYPEIIEDANNMLSWLENGKIVIKNQTDEYGYYQYDDFRTEKEKQQARSAWDRAD